MSVHRISTDLRSNARKDGMTIEVPLNPGAVKTVVVLVLGEDGRVHVSGPMNEPSVMTTLLRTAQAMLEEYQSRKLIQVVNGVVGLKGQGNA